LLDLDRELVELFAGKSTHPISQTLNQLNQNALNHPSVDWLFHDAFIAIDELYQAGKTFDVVIIDLPDPSHPDLNRLYTVHFYKRLKRLLTHQGRLVIQSTSPFFAKNAFISIANTLKTAGLTQVQQYRVSVPSFGEWGFTLALGNSTGFWDLIDQVPTKWLTTEMFKATMVFPKNYYANASDIEPNRLGTHRLYQYHQDAWRKFQ